MQRSTGSPLQNTWQGPTVARHSITGFKKFLDKTKYDYGPQSSGINVYALPIQSQQETIRLKSSALICLKN